MAIEPKAIDLEEAVREWVALGSGLDFDTKVINGSSKVSVSPKGLYATVLRITDTPEGDNFNRYTVDDETVSYQSIDTLWSVQWFREGARDAARAFQVWAKSQVGIDAAAVRGMTVYRINEVARLDTIMPPEQGYESLGDWEERVGVDINLGVVLKYTSDTPPAVDTVDVEATLEN